MSTQEHLATAVDWKYLNWQAEAVSGQPAETVVEMSRFDTTQECHSAHIGYISVGHFQGEQFAAGSAVAEDSFGIQNTASPRYDDPRIKIFNSAARDLVVRALQQAQPEGMSRVDAAISLVASDPASVPPEMEHHTPEIAPGLIAPRAAMTDLELFNAMLSGTTLSQKLRSLFTIARHSIAETRSEREFDENTSRRIVLIARAQAAQAHHLSPELTRLIDRAVGQFMQRNRPFCIAAVRKFRVADSLVPFEDLLQEGNIGFLDALRRYDLSRTEKVMSFCSHRIRGAALDAIRLANQELGISRGDISRGKYVEELLLCGERPAWEDIALELGTTAERLKLSYGRFRRSHPAALSSLGMATLYRSASETERDFTALLTDPDSDLETEALASLGESSEVDAIIANLPPREAHMIRLYFCYDTAEPASMAEIGQRFGISESRVSQIIKLLLDKIHSQLPSDVRPRRVGRNIPRSISAHDVSHLPTGDGTPPTVTR